MQRPGGRSGMSAVGARWWVAFVAVPCGLLAACSTAAVAPSIGTDAQERWQEAGSSSYTVVLESACGERALIGRFKVTVADDEVTALEGLDEPGRRNDGAIDDVPTVDDLLDRITGDDRDAVRELEVDGSTGMPTYVLLDPSPGTDDEECYTLSDYRPAG